MTAKIDWDAAIEQIIALRASGRMLTQSAIASEVGVGESFVGKVLRLEGTGGRQFAPRNTGCLIMLEDGEFVRL